MGNYEVYVDVAAGTEYSAAQNVLAGEYSITKATPTVTLSIRYFSSEYGYLFEIRVSPKPAYPTDGKFSIFRGDAEYIEPTALAPDGQFALNRFIDPGSTSFKAYYSGDNNLNAAESATFTLAIEKLDAKLDLDLLKTLTASYGDTLGDVVLPTQTDGANTTAGRYVWQDAGTTPVGAIGSRKFDVKFIPTHSDWYNEVQGFEVDLTVGKRDLRVKADDKQIDAGRPIPPLTLTWTQSDFVFGETEADIDTPPVASTAATAEFPPGKYPILLSGGADEHYNIVTTDGELTVNAIPVTGVTLDQAALTLAVDGTHTLAATVAPDNATNKTVTWSSSNTAVATVDANGKVTAVAPGNATITVTTQDGGKTATCDVTARAANYAVTSNFAPFTGSGSRSATVNAAAGKFMRLLMGGTAIDPKNYSVTSGSTIITLNEAYLKTLANGTYAVTAEFTDGAAQLSLTVNVQTTTRGSTSAATGDDTNIGLWITLAVVAGGAIFYALQKRRRRPI